MTSRGGNVSFLTKKKLPTKVVDAPTYSTFENIVISVMPPFQNLLWLCVSIVHQVHVPWLFLMTSCFFFGGFLSSLTSSFIICGDFNIHVDTGCIDQQKFLNLLDSSNLVQIVNKPTHFHGHILFYSEHL